jgi:hypothetical protein
VIIRLLILLITNLLITVTCSHAPNIDTDEIMDLSYDELKQQYISCKGKGVMTAQGELPWKLNYSFSTQNDSSFIQFRDIFGRRVLFVQALPNEITLWDMQKNLQYNSNFSTVIPIFNIVETNDIAQILWGKIPKKLLKIDEESGFEKDLTVVNFNSSVTRIGMVLDKVTFNLDSIGAKVEFKISERNYGKAIPGLLKGIPKNIPYN